MKKKILPRIFCALLTALTVLPVTKLPAAAAGIKIDGPTALTPSDFKVPAELWTEEEGDCSFTVANGNTWSTPKTTKYSMTGTFTVNVDETPIIYLSALKCDVQFDAYYKAEDGVNHYINDLDQADWRRGMCSAKVDMQERHGWTGVHTITVVLEYILWEIPSADEPGVYVNRFAGLGFNEKETFTVNPYFANGAVLQQEKPIVIAGKGTAGAEFSAVLSDAKGEKLAEGSGKADASGAFLLSLPAQKAGYDKLTLTITDGKSSKKFTDLLIGEVWMTGGQSNMQYKLGWAFSGVEMDESDADDEYLRAALVETSTPVWLKGNSLSEIKNVSAIAYHFAAELRRALNVPVAVIDTAAGETTVYHWVTEEMLKEDKELASFAKNKVGEKVGQLYGMRMTSIETTAVRGLLWYQGEGNCGDAEGYYRRALALLRKNWGDRFGCEGEVMPMIVSHLAAHNYGEHLPSVPPAFAEELTAFCAGAPERTAQITIYDQPLDYESPAQYASVAPIHPATKAAVGQRMAASALSMVYGIGEEVTAPVVKSSEIRDGAVYVTFDHVGDGLAAGGKELHGFTVLDGRYATPAYAEVVGKDTVRIYSPYVADPQGATYAWSAMNQYSDLFSTRDGALLLPAVPFRIGTAANTVYYVPHDWTYCDSAELWHSDASEAKWVSAWESPSGTVSFDTENAYSGSAALSLSYTADAEGTVTVSPVLDFGLSASNSDADPDYSMFRLLRFRVKNGGNADLTVRAVRFTAAGKACEVPVDAVIPANGTWTTVRALLEDLSCGGVQVKTSLLKKVTAIDFVFSTEAGGTGTLLLDDVLFSASVADEPIPDETDPGEKEPASGLLSTLLIVGGVCLIAAAAAAVLLRRKKK